MLRTFLNMFITQETPLLSGWCFYVKMLSCFSNFLQTTSAAYGYYPYLFPFLLSSIHHMVLDPCGSEVRHLFSHHFPEFPFASCGTDDTCTTGYVRVQPKVPSVSGSVRQHPYSIRCLVSKILSCSAYSRSFSPRSPNPRNTICK